MEPWVSSPGMHFLTKCVSLCVSIPWGPWKEDMASGASAVYLALCPRPRQARIFSDRCDDPQHRLIETQLKSWCPVSHFLLSLSSGRFPNTKQNGPQDLTQGIYFLLSQQERMFCSTLRICKRFVKYIHRRSFLWNPHFLAAVGLSHFYWFIVQLQETKQLSVPLLKFAPFVS